MVLPILLRSCKGEGPGMYNIELTVYANTSMPKACDARAHGTNRDWRTLLDSESARETVFSAVTIFRAGFAQLLDGKSGPVMSIPNNTVMLTISSRQDDTD